VQVCCAAVWPVTDPGSATDGGAVAASVGVALEGATGGAAGGAFGSTEVPAPVPPVRAIG